MNNKKIIELLDVADEYMRKNINEKCKAINPNNIYGRLNLQKLNEIIKELDKKNVQGSIRNRAIQVRDALNYAILSYASLPQNNRYFDWLQADKNTHSYAEPNIDLLYYEVLTGHESKFNASYLEKTLNVEGKKLLLSEIHNIQQEYEEFSTKDVKMQQQALAVKTKPNIIQRLFSKLFSNKIENKENSKENNEPKRIKAEKGSFKTELRDMDNYSQRIEQPNYIKHEEQTIVISDLHGDMTRWNKVKAEIKKNPNMKIIILGDAMDRGDFGLEILLQIKDLCDKGIAEYLPGNHDVFAYNFMRTLTTSRKQPEDNDKMIKIMRRAIVNLLHNGGEETEKDLRENYKTKVTRELQKGNISKYITRDELMEWLGKQPIQKKTNGRDKTDSYALAHAIFDEDLYELDPNFNLEKAFQLELQGNKLELLDKFETVMWFREGDSKTYRHMPRLPKDCIMVAGHTRQTDINMGYIENNPKQPIIYVDTGKGDFKGFSLTTGEDICFEKNEEKEKNI